MAPLAISPAIAEIAKSYPDVNVSMVQSLVTLPGFSVMIVSFLSSFLARRICKKYLASIGSLIVACSGIAGFLWHSSIEILLVWAVLLGIGVGLFISTNSSMIAEFFTEEIRAKIVGRQSLFATLGGVFFTLAGGILCRCGWHYNYLVLVIGIGGFVCGIKWLPKEKLEETVIKVRISREIWFYLLYIFGFIFLYNNIPTNLSFYVVEQHLGTSELSGSILAVFLMGGVLGGALFDRLQKKLEDQILIAAGILLAVGGIGVYLTRYLPMLILILLLSGMSINFVMSQLIFQISRREKRENIPFSMAMLMAVNNLAQLVSPIMTQAAGIIMKNKGTGYRYLFLGIAAVILTARAIPRIYGKTERKVEDS